MSTGVSSLEQETSIREQINRILMQAMGEIFNLDSPNNNMYVTHFCLSPATFLPAISTLHRCCPYTVTWVLELLVNF